MNYPKSYTDYMKRYGLEDRFIGRPFTDPISKITLPYGTEIVDPMTGRKFKFGFSITQDLMTTEAYRRAIDSYAKDQQPVSGQIPKYNAPTRTLPVERPDFSRPPASGGYDPVRRWGIGGPGGIDLAVVGPSSWRFQAQVRPDLIGLPYQEALEIYKRGSSGGGMGMRERAMGGMR